MKVGPPSAAQPPGLDPPRMKQKQNWSHGRVSGHGVASAVAGAQGWESAVGHTAWTQGRVYARSAFQMPVASLLGHNGCKLPGRSHRGQGRGQRWTCLGGERSNDEVKKYNGYIEIRLQRRKHADVIL